MKEPKVNRDYLQQLLSDSDLQEWLEATLKSLFLEKPKHDPTAGAQWREGYNSALADVASRIRRMAAK